MVLSTKEATVRFIWTKRTIEQAEKGKRDPMHTISAPNIADVYDGYVNQLRPGTPWQLRNAADDIVAHGIA